MTMQVSTLSSNRDPASLKQAYFRRVATEYYNAVAWCHDVKECATYVVVETGVHSKCGIDFCTQYRGNMFCLLVLRKL